MERRVLWIDLPSQGLVTQANGLSQRMADLCVMAHSPGQYRIKLPRWGTTCCLVQLEVSSVRF